MGATVQDFSPASCLLIGETSSYINKVDPEITSGLQFDNIAIVLKKKKKLTSLNSEQNWTLSRERCVVVSCIPSFSILSFWKRLGR